MIRGGIVTLNVSDVGQAVRFYVETLGLKLVTEAADGSAVIDAGDGFLIGLRKRSTEALSCSSIALYTKVPIEEAMAIYENRGVAFTIERTSGATVARFRDPDENVLSLMQGV